jgi:predicted DsbA family dithiol-disulfide isomerase
VRWTAFPLHPETPPEGHSLEALFAGRSVDIPAMVEHLSQVAAAEGLAFGKRTHTYNSRLAQELSKWAETQEAGDAFHHAVFRAYFADGKNIARPEVLVGIAENMGLDPREASRVLEQRSFREEVDLDWARCHTLGIHAVPTFMVAGQRLVGAKAYEDLARFVEATRSMPHLN